MYFRKRGASVALVALVACLVMSFAQPMFREGSTHDNCPTLASSASTTRPHCSTYAVWNMAVTSKPRRVEVQWDVLRSCQVEYTSLRYKAYRKEACKSQCLQNTDYLPVNVSHDANRYYANISDLEPYTSYELGIAAKKPTQGNVQWITQSITTDASAPPSPHVRVDRARSSNTLIFNWDRLTCSNVNGAFIRNMYRAVLKRSNVVRKSTLLPETSSSVTFTNLFPCISYTISLTAINGEGEGSPAVLAATTRAKVINAHVSTTGHRSLSVSWRVHGRCQNYEREYTVTYQLTNTSCGPSFSEPQRQTVFSQDKYISTEITGLKAFATYRVRVSITGVSDSAYNGILENTTFPKAPLGVRNLISRSHGDNQLSFFWSAPLCEDLHGDFYCYNYKLIRVSNAEIEDDGCIQNIQKAYNDLQGCAFYRFEVQVVTWNGTNYFYSDWDWTTAQTPARVINAHVSATGSGSLSVSWNVHERCPDNEREYIVTYQLTSTSCGPSSSLAQTQTVSSQDKYISTEITGLKAFATYRVWVSVTGVFDSAYTGILENTTFPKAPLGVRNLNSGSHGANQLSFSWSAPLCKNLHGDFDCYKYKLIRVSNAEIEDDGCIRNIQKAHRIDDLQGCTFYRFEVQVVTRNGTDQFYSDWDWTTAQTPARAPGVPSNVIARPSLQSVSEAWVRWEAPIDNPCKPVAYDVTYELLYKDMCKEPSVRTVNSTTSRPTEVDHTTIRSTIRGLLPYSVYKVCVRGWNTVGGGPGECVNLTTGVDEPSSTPTQVYCTSSSYDSLTFTWDKPLCGDRKGPISEYEYRLNDRGSSKPRRGNVTGDENGGTVTITNLSPSTTYTFKVRAVNNFNPFGSYARTEADTLVAIFNPPVKVAVMSLNESTAAVEWFAPLPSDLNITEYRIEWWESGLKEKTSVVVSHEANVCGSSCRKEETIIGLKPATNHSIQVIAKYKYGEGKSDVLEFRTPEEVRASPSRQAAAMTPVLVSIFVIIFVLLLVIAAMLYSRKTDRKIFSSEWFPISFPDIRNAVRRARAAPGKSTQMSNNRNRNHTEREQNGRGLEMEMAGVVSQINNHANQEMESNMSCSIYENMPAQFTKHQAIPEGQLLGYVARRNADGSNSLDEDFKSLPSQKLHSQDIALKEENKEKNRFTNILPYDHSRVKLSMVHGDPHSDYINASFIDGYKTPKKYIAAQGPNTASVDSFWRMVWQYDCRKIVMLTNLREANKKKCEKYWPAERESYGDIWMTLVKEEINDNYTVRYFNLVCNNTGRDVVQYHYTSWPDMGVPEFSAHLMSFVRITREPLKSHHKGPTIVHCSAGVGRTGTFLTLDAMLDQVQAEQAMDIHSFITSMRQNRPLMVQTKKQYRFIYEALLQDQTCGDTGISRDAFGETYQSLISRTTGMTGIKQQFELLQALTISPHEEETAAARSDDNVGKNRFPDKVPSGRTRPFLMTEVEGGNDYINASFLPGYVSKNQYIGTQTPLPNTVIDFWRLVVDYKVNTIVMLHGNSRDKTYAQYWPTEGSKRYGPYTVDILKEEYNRPIMHRTLEVTEMDSKKASSKKVKQLQLASCPPQSETPPSLTDVMDLHRALLSALGTTVWKEGDSPLLIHCRDGEGMTAVFCAFLAVLDHLDSKQTIDVFHACRKIRTSRPGAVASLAQYQFIYEAVKSFMISSSIYENMAKIV